MKIIRIFCIIFIIFLATNSAYALPHQLVNSPKELEKKLAFNSDGLSRNSQQDSKENSGDKKTLQNSPDNSDAKKSFNFLALADIHFDPFLNCSWLHACPLINKLNASPAKQWRELFAQYHVQAPQFRKDSNFFLLESALSAAKQAAQSKHAQFVLMLGDFFGHEFYSKYKRYSNNKSKASYHAFLYKFLEFLTLELQSAFPSIDIYAVAGNNDSYQGDYVSKINGEFFNDAAQQWSSLIKNPVNRAAMQKQFSYAGYYSVILPYPENIKLIVLNTNIFSYKAKGKNLDAAAQREFDWLNSQLQTAKNNRQSVFIAMHIPEGVDVYITMRTRLMRVLKLWKPQYIQRFQALLNQYATEIAGIFSGHLHADSLRIATYADKHEIPLVGVTSISPIFGNNPGFEIFSYRLNPLHLETYSLYSFSMYGEKIWLEH
jgi:sphingomyelin phosphodiesterase acid-like 3